MSRIPLLLFAESLSPNIKALGIAPYTTDVRATVRSSSSSSGDTATKHSEASCCFLLLLLGGDSRLPRPRALRRQSV